ncbi:MAG: lipid-A-disaccharide synthase [Opitutales bacterium]|jgi:lipid-A-disaccharide synthase|nr:lipid-A-disaccharide synthase [Opitutales bacterium]MDP4775094.1 lipid-A-disaccharide synthase [Opitutales bacterium]MDP4787888.1 lipid-A-disaccharide synthase [Opitutales bacterium]MDP4861532.1 lipid-A-disaccharide synthase [Opitutales bacterium]MDP4894972.1 lipid-A-disaccharide synthase [Opitutales bacterium]
MSVFPAIPASFDRPRGGAVDVLVVAGEHSGDQHAAKVVADLLAARPGLRVAAFGGPQLRAAGAQLLFDMTTFSAVGIVEILSAYPFYRRLFGRMVTWTKQWKPKVVVLVDYPGLNLRLANELRKAGLSRAGFGETAVIQYVSPQLWAWKPKRRFTMARDLDGVGTIFPFEPACYADTKLDARFVGHPFAEKEHVPGLRHDPDGPVLLLPGSRPKPVRKIFPSLVEAFALFRRHHPKRRALVLHTGGEVHAELYRLLAEYGEEAKGIDLRPVSEGPAAGCAALVSSGTMSLTVALAGIPGAVVYRANPLTWIMGRTLIAGRVDHLGIANILLKRPAWPEYLQGACEPEALAARLQACVEGPEPRAQAAADAAELLGLLSAKSGSTPAEWVASYLPKEVRP